MAESWPGALVPCNATEPAALTPSGIRVHNTA
jgi:hypothetical protein